MNTSSSHFNRNTADVIAAPRRTRSAQRGGIISRLMFLIFVIAVVFVLFILRHPLLRMIGNFWVVSDPLQRSDVIVTLSDDNYQGDRAARAAQLFKAGWAPKIVVSGRFLRDYVSLAEMSQKDLTQDGVPGDAITKLTHRAPDTIDEEKIIAQLAVQKHWQHVIIVTSNYHTRRARFIARRVFPSSIDVMMESAPDVEYDPDNWWRTRIGIKLFFHESVGYLANMWEVRPLSGSHAAQ